MNDDGGNWWEFFVLVVEYKLIYDFIYCLGWYAGKWFEGLK